MEFKQLEAFVQISKLHSFSKASEALFLTQPALSSQINALEKEMGVQLFIRSTKKIYPTKAGVKFYEYAQKILALREQSVFEMGCYSKECTGEINILASSVPAQYILPQLIANFNKEYPQIIFHLYQKDSSKVFEELMKYQYDMGFVGTSIDGGRYAIAPLCKDKLVLILPKNMKRPEFKTIDDLASFIIEKQFIMREKGSGTRAEVSMFLSKCQISEKDLKTTGYFSSTQGVVEAVSQGMGISFVSKIAAQTYQQLGLIQIVDIDSEFINRNIYCVLKKDMLLTPAQNIFVNYTRNCLVNRQ